MLLCPEACQAMQCSSSLYCDDLAHQTRALDQRPDPHSIGATTRHDAAAGSDVLRCRMIGTITGHVLLIKAQRSQHGHDKPQSLLRYHHPHPQPRLRLHHHLHCSSPQAEYWPACWKYGQNA